MGQIAEFSGKEMWVTATARQERYSERVPIAHADSGIRLRTGGRVLTDCPAVFWQVGFCNFVVARTGDRRRLCMSSYRGYQPYGTGVDEYDDLAEWMVNLLQARADHVRELQQQH